MQRRPSVDYCVEVDTTSTQCLYYADVETTSIQHLYDAYVDTALFVRILYVNVVNLMMSVSK